ncbi:MAG: hypothetical protein ACRDK2_15920 [Solirubrobacteraceae bacterium]
MDRASNFRNVAIVLLIAAVVYFVPGAGRATDIAEALLYVGFGMAFGYVGLRLYRERQMNLQGLGVQHRALLYGAIAAAMLLWMSRVRMWEAGLGEFLWFVLVGLVVYALMLVVRRWRAY